MLSLCFICCYSAMYSFHVGKLIYMIFFLLNIGSIQIDGQKHTAPWIPEDNSICCKEHPSVGRCLPNIDDSAEKGGKCWKFCIEGCETGGFCKLFGHKHICHCNCSG
ncbi:putative defensin-like protein 20-27 [Arabidopsis thaliana]